MTGREPRDWPAQPPPPDFAGRAVLAILAAEQRPARARTKRRWPMLLAAAVVFAGAGAWAAMGGFRPEPPTPFVEPTPPAPPPPVVEQPEPVSAPRVSDEPPDAGVAVVPARPRATPALSAPPPPPVAEPLDAGRWIMVPSCTCSPFEGICSCVE